MNETGVDNFALAAPLDFASYDNYPLGRSDLLLSEAPTEELRPYMRTGHPDFATTTKIKLAVYYSVAFGLWSNNRGP